MEIPIHTPNELGLCNEIKEGEIDAPFLKEIGAAGETAAMGDAPLVVSFILDIWEINLWIKVVRNLSVIVYVRSMELS